MTLFEALYGQKCRSLICWDEFGESKDDNMTSYFLFPPSSLMRCVWFKRNRVFSLNIGMSSGIVAPLRHYYIYKTILIILFYILI